MDTICWILKDEEKSKIERLTSFCVALASQDFAVEWKTFTAEASDVSQQIPSNATAVFLAENDSKWVEELVRKLKSEFAAQKKAIPICYFDADEKFDEWNDVVRLGCDEVLSLSDSPMTIKARLSMAKQRLQQTQELHGKLSTKNVESAKSETILKQREEFLSIAAHDLRSPLGLIQSSLSMILGSAKSLTDFQEELLGRAKRQATQALGLVNDLLDVMAYEQGLRPDFQLFHLDTLLKEFQKDFGFHAEQRKIKVHYENPVPNWRVLADADRIRQLFQNLFVNAIKFTEEGKNIYLSVMSFQGRRKADPPYPMIVVSLRDEGKGIPTEELKKIFDRFSQVKGAGRSEGRGLGLTVAKQISTLHGGNIWVQSVEGKGSTFFVLFPHVISRTEIPKLQPVIAKRMKKVIISEPAPSKREGYYELIGRWGYEPVFVKDGIEAVTLTYYVLPDLVILTESLQRMSEDVVAEVLKSDPITRTIPILLAIETGVNPQKKYENLAVDQLLKVPFNRETFQIAVDRASKKIKKAAA